MLAEELINQKIPPLRPTDSVRKAGRWFEQLRVAELPVVDRRQYLGLLHESEISDEVEGSQPLLVLAPWADAAAFVYTYQHFYYVMEAAIRHHLSVVPVLNAQNEYVGLITISDAITAFGGLSSAMRGDGSILVLTMPERDYSLTQISRYVEEENAKILSAFTAEDESDAYNIRLTLRLNTPDPSRIVATLERFGFYVSAQFRDSSPLGPRPEDERLDSLLHYLNI